MKKLILFGVIFSVFTKSLFSQCNNIPAPSISPNNITLNEGEALILTAITTAKNATFKWMGPDGIEYPGAVWSRNLTLNMQGEYILTQSVKKGKKICTSTAKMNIKVMRNQLCYESTNNGNNLNYFFYEDGKYNVSILKVQQGNVTSFSPCLEGQCTNLPDRCKNNPAQGNSWTWTISKDCPITIWKSEIGGTSAQTQILLESDNLKNNILVWQNAGGFRIELKISRTTN